MSARKIKLTRARNEPFPSTLMMFSFDKSWFWGSTKDRDVEILSYIWDSHRINLCTIFYMLEWFHLWNYIKRKSHTIFKQLPRKSKLSVTEGLWEISRLFWSIVSFVVTTKSLESELNFDSLELREKRPKLDAYS